MLRAQILRLRHLCGRRTPADVVGGDDRRAAGIRRPGCPGHSRESFSAGEPGNPKKPARVVMITMREEPGKMMFIPSKVEVKKGEQIRFMLRNSGALEHEFMLATAAENAKHAELMKKYPGHGARRSQRQAAQAQRNSRNRLEVHQGGRVSSSAA